jgi:hypothetical protein
MFRWLKKILFRRPYRIAQPWETPPEIRTKLRCAIAGIDPCKIHEPRNDEPTAKQTQPALETPPPQR